MRSTAGGTSLKSTLRHQLTCGYAQPLKSVEAAAALGALRHSLGFEKMTVVFEQPPAT